jgi:hypothetical protein
MQKYELAMINAEENLRKSAAELLGAPPVGEANSFLRNEASAYLKARWGLSYAVYTLARYAANGTGPEYQRVGPRAVYTRAALDEWAKTKLTAPGRKAADLRPLAEGGQTEV